MVDWAVEGPMDGVLNKLLLALALEIDLLLIFVLGVGLTLAPTTGVGFVKGLSDPWPV